MKRRTFVKYAASLAVTSKLPSTSYQQIMKENCKTIRIIHTNSNFEREKLRFPFGFKGGYLTELWQTIARLQSERFSGTGLATQSVLYGDADFFAHHSEAAGNALMFALTEKALRVARSIPFTTPMQLMKEMQPVLMDEARKLTDKKDININFLMNALVSVDNAAWLLYAAENDYHTFEDMLPAQYRPALSHKNEKVAVMFQVSYGMPLDDIREAADQGYFIFKIKTGQPGTQQEMLTKDKQRLKDIHAVLKDLRTPHTPDGKLLYTMDCNGRYEHKDLLKSYIGYAEQIGALDQVLFIEEPFDELNETYVGDLGLRIGADESAHDEASALRRIQQGYGVMVLKDIAKTLSVSVAIAKLAHEHNIPCICADLTVNPLLVNWNKNIAARVAPYPGLQMGMLETNGDMNYENWKTMLGYQPSSGASWNQVINGAFELNTDFFDRSGGIFEPSSHYNNLVS